MTQVGSEIIEERYATGVVNLLAHEQRTAPETFVSVPTCFLLAQPTLHTGFHFALDVEAQFVVDFALQMRAANGINEAGPATAPARHASPHVGLRAIEMAADRRAHSRCSCSSRFLPARVTE